MFSASGILASPFLYRTFYRLSLHLKKQKDVSIVNPVNRLIAHNAMCWMLPPVLGKTKEPPAKKMKNIELPSDEVLRYEIHDLLLKDHSRLKSRKGKFQDIASQLERIYNAESSINKGKHLKMLIRQEERLRLSEEASEADKPASKEAAEATEVNAAEQSDEGVPDPGKRGLKDGLLLTSELMEQRRHLSPRTTATQTPGTSTIGAHPAEQQAATWRSFTAAIESTDSFCVGTHWISKLKEDEQAALARICLEAGYERTHQTSTTILFERIDGNTANEGGDGGCDSKPSTSSQNKDSDVQKPGKAESASLLRKRKIGGDQTDITSSSLGPALLTETSQAQDKNCTCHPQILTVSCSSSSGFPEEIQPPPRKRNKMLRLGDMVVTLPNKVRSEMVTTTIDKRFSINTFDISNGQEVPVNFKATVTNQLSCCLKAHNDRHKLRIKLSRIYGEVENESPNDSLCHATVLTTVCTNLLATRIDEEDESDVISLKLENEQYHHPPHHILLPNTTPTRGDPMTTADRLEWLSVSNIFPKGCSHE
ncbi:unnamed protein product [Calypogeia fissa]